METTQDVSDRVATKRNQPRNFTEIKGAVAQQFKAISGHELFRTAVEKDDLWACYMNSFPEGFNPIFRKRAEHDCSCCRQFVRAVGNVVAIIDGRLVSVWDVTVSQPAYQLVVNAMAALVKSQPIENCFLHTERTAGTDKSFEDALGSVKTWEHFFVNIPHGQRGERNFVCAGRDTGPKLSEARALHDVLLRSLTELTLDAADTVLELIAQNSLYRGEEHKHAISVFRQTKMAFDQLAEEAREPFVWAKIGELPGSVSKIRNTSIGTLLTDLSEGRDMESAVRAFESMVAPANYKRPTALVTKAMIEKARATIEELGLLSALDRRYATLADITINNILFANRSTKAALAGDVFDDIAGSVAAKPKTLDKVEEIGIEKFLTDILPAADSIELLVEGRHTNNLVSLIAPVDATAGKLFKWDNPFSWSYNGDFADSIKERVKKAGGNVSGDLCCRLAWFNFDDLDFHMIEPNGYEIYFGNRHRISPSGGQLDVDMNAGHGQTREAVENIFYSRASTMREGAYKLVVNNFCQRESVDVGFEAELDFRGTVYRFACDRPVKNRENIVVAEFHYSKAGGVEIIKSLPTTLASKNIWGVNTETFHKVNVVMLSPNHWDDRGIGNKHYFFMLDGCKNDGTARGFFNEFLKTELDPHRKVFEIVGARMRADDAASQLSGLGFSSTQRNHAIVRISGAFKRVIRVTF